MIFGFKKKVEKKPVKTKDEFYPSNNPAPANDFKKMMGLSFIQEEVEMAHR